MAGGDVGGAEEFFVRLAPALQRRGIEQHLIVRRNDSRNERLRDLGLSLVELPFGGFLDRKTIPGMIDEIESFRPQVMLSWMSRASAMTARAVRRSSERPVLLGRLGGYYSLKYFDGCDHLIGNTPDIVQYLTNEGWPAEKGHYVPNFVSAEAGTAVGRADLGVPDTAPLLIAAGRLHPNKAFDVLLHALKRVPTAYLLVAGDGASARELESLAYKLGISDRVRFLGWRRDMADLMAAADILVCPSRIEPLGNVVIEAWARQVPVVAAASAGPAWLIRDGVDGLLAPVENYTALAAAITRLVEAPAVASSLARAGVVRFREEFAEEAVVDRFVAMFEKVCP